MPHLQQADGAYKKQWGLSKVGWGNILSQVRMHLYNYCIDQLYSTWVYKHSRSLNSKSVQY